MYVLPACMHGTVVTDYYYTRHMGAENRILFSAKADNALNYLLTK